MLLSLLTYSNVLFGFFSYTMNNQYQYRIVSLILLLAKYHIHKSKFSNHNFLIFKSKFKHYIFPLLHSKNRKAVKTTDLCALHNIYIVNSFFSIYIVSSTVWLPWHCSLFLCSFYVCVWYYCNIDNIVNKGGVILKKVKPTK